MQTQVSILVKNESIFSRLMTTAWFINIFKKMSVMVKIDDGEVQKLKASKEPYVFDLTPGTHKILFKDPKEKAKKRSRFITGLFLGAAGGVSGALSLGDAFAGNTVRDGCVEFTLSEGDVLEIWCKNTAAGGVKLNKVK